MTSYYGPYRWTTDIPIQEFDGGDKDARKRFKDLTLQMGYDIHAYTEDLVNATEANKHIGPISHAHQSGNIAGVKMMLKMFESSKYNKDLEKYTKVLCEGRVGFAYIILGRPVALLVLMKGGPYGWVCDLLASPAVKGAGVTMIEWAVNYRVQKERKEPSLGLYPVTDQAREAYDQMGFRGKSDMFLDAQTAEKWKQIEGRWVYVSTSAAKVPNAPKEGVYLTTDADDPGILPPLPSGH